MMENETDERSRYLVLKEQRRCLDTVGFGRYFSRNKRLDVI